MELNIENFKIRKSKPIIYGNAGLPENVERYNLKGMEMIGIDIFKDDILIILNIEGSQICEMSFFDNMGKCRSILNAEYNSEANFIKKKLKKITT